MVGQKWLTGNGDDDPFADQRIFVSIPADRDCDLPQTVRNALDTAARPSRLRFSICHQFDDATSGDMDAFADDPRCTVDRVPYSESLGMAWARARANDAYDGEPYLLQIGARMRFADGWDHRCIAMLEATGSERSIITNDPPAFWLDDGVGEPRGEQGGEQGGGQNGPTRLCLVPDGRAGTFRRRSEPAPMSARPGRQFLVAAGNLFSRGQFVLDVPCDPTISSEDEEITLAIRAYTHGYDMYWPEQSVIYRWRQQRSDDRADALSPEMSERFELERLRRRLSTAGPFGIGQRRTLAAYCDAAGLHTRPLDR